MSRGWPRGRGRAAPPHREPNAKRQMTFCGRPSAPREPCGDRRLNLGLWPLPILKLQPQSRRRSAAKLGQPLLEHPPHHLWTAGNGGLPWHQAARRALLLLPGWLSPERRRGCTHQRRRHPQRRCPQDRSRLRPCSGCAPSAQAPMAALQRMTSVSTHCRRITRSSSRACPGCAPFSQALIEAPQRMTLGSTASSESKASGRKGRSLAASSGESKTLGRKMPVSAGAQSEGCRCTATWDTRRRRCSKR